jgi:arsenite methyltransferase
VIPNGVVNFSADKRRGFAEVARVLPPAGRLALADIVTERQIATPTARHAELWAACIAGASHVDLYVKNIGSADRQL